MMMMSFFLHFFLSPHTRYKRSIIYKGTIFLYYESFMKNIYLHVTCPFSVCMMKMAVLMNAGVYCYVHSHKIYIHFG